MEKICFKIPETWPLVLYLNSHERNLQQSFTVERGKVNLQFKVHSCHKNIL